MSETKIARLEAELEMARTEIASLKIEITSLNDDANRVAKSFDAERAGFKTAIGKEKAGIHIALAALSAGVMREALDDVVARAEREGWKTDEHNNPVLWDAKNDSPVYSAKGFGNLTPEEWATGLKTVARHYFGTPGDSQPQSGDSQPQSGGGRSQSGGGRSQSGGGIEVSGSNPWVAATWDDMAQVQMIQTNRARAEAMAKAAGSFIGALNPALGGKKAAY